MSPNLRPIVFGLKVRTRGFPSSFFVRPFSLFTSWRCSRWSRSALQKERGVLAEQRVVLEQEPVSGVWIEDELGVGQPLRQDKRVYGRDDYVMAPARDQDRVRNCAHMRVGRVLGAIPPRQGCSLRLYPRAHERRIALAFSRLEPIPEGRACRLARLGRFKEELEQSVPGWGNDAASRIVGLRSWVPSPLPGPVPARMRRRTSWGWCKARC